ncbi:hypothetical protein ACFOW4_00105 [Micromonospora sp. GCM10011542]|uniref:hypothetical protein n=1 Tax=Micromonospora sp. GCM10011542 TaxID=3317337 RepID=UPI00360638F2
MLARRRRPIVLIDTRTGARQPYWAELDATAADRPDRQALIIRPARNLAENTRYAVGLRRLRTATGAPVAPSATFTLLRAPTPPADPALHRRWEYTQRALGSLAAAGVDTASWTWPGTSPSLADAG